METLEISESVLNFIKNENAKIILSIGTLNSPRKDIIQKYANETKSFIIHVKDLLKKEFESEGEIGVILRHYQQEKQPYPSILLLSLILREIQDNKDKVKNKTFIVDGYPRNLEDAIEWEKNVNSLDVIISFLAKKETCIKLGKIKAAQKGKEFSEEAFNTKYDEKFENLNQIGEFYKKLSVYKEINAEKSEIEMTTEFKKYLYPSIYTIIGKRYSGKTTLSKELEERQKVHLIDFNAFKQKPKFKKHQDDSALVMCLIKYLYNCNKPRVLIENFPENKVQYSYFVNNCKEFERIYYLNADNSTCLERRNALPITDPNYIDCSELSKKLYEFEQKAEFIKFLKKQTVLLKPKDENGFFVDIIEEKPKPKKVEPEGGEDAPKVKKEEKIDLTNRRLILMEVDVNNHKPLTIEKLIDQIKPYIILPVAGEQYEEAKNNFVNHLKEKYGFKVINYAKTLESYQSKKGNPTENQEEESDNIKMSFLDTLNILKPMIFNENYNKYILEGVPSTPEEAIEFEKYVCPISKLVIFSSDNCVDSKIGYYFQNKSKLIQFQPEEITEFQYEEALNMVRDVNIIYGMPLSGKSAIARHLKNHHNFSLLDFHDLIKKIKTIKAKSDPENPDAEPDSVEINFDEFIEGLKNHLEKESKGHRILIDNLFIPGGAEPFIVDNLDKAKTVVNTIGRFRNFYLVDVSEEKLLERYKAKEGIAEELNEEQKAAYDESHKAPKELMDLIISKSCRTIKIDNNEGLVNAMKNYDDANKRHFIALKHDYNVNLEAALEEITSREKMLYVNVPKLIYKHFCQNDEMSKKLEDSYGKVPLKDEVVDKENPEGIIYYKYNPIHFDPTLVNQMINDYIDENYQQMEGRSNFVVLSGFLNNDLVLDYDPSLGQMPKEEVKKEEAPKEEKPKEAPKEEEAPKEDEAPKEEKPKEEEQKPEEPIPVPKSDLSSFNLPLKDIDKLLQFGELTQIIFITKNDLPVFESEQPVQLIIEKKKVEKPKDVLDVDGNPEAQENQENQQEEQPPEEENNPDGVPKFKPEGLFWTNYDGNPRNYLQILKRLTNLDIDQRPLIKSGGEEEDPLKDCTIEKRLYKTLDGIFTDHLSKYEARKESGYKGIINYIQLNY